MNLLHTGSKVTFIKIFGKDFIKFEFSNINEARNRAISLAIKTYRISKGSGYIKLFSEKEI